MIYIIMLWKHNIDDEPFLIQEKQLKKVRAKQKRLQAILGGEDTQRVEAELLAEDDGEEGEVYFILTCVFFSVYWLKALSTH